jgi:hypothetical protein
MYRRIQIEIYALDMRVFISVSLTVREMAQY